MVRYTDKRVKKALKKFIKKIKEKFNIQKVLLFGSRARGDYFLDSDVDLILVSDDFKEKKFIDRIADILGYWNEEIDIEPLCYTPEEFEKKKKQIGIVRDAVEEGIEIK